VIHANIWTFGPRSPQIRSVFRLRGTSEGLTDLILPDVGSADVVVQLGESSMLSRLADWETPPREYVLGLSQRPIGTRYGSDVDIVGIRLTPACACALGCRAAELLDTMTPLADGTFRHGRRLSSWARAFSVGRATLDQLVDLVSATRCSCDAIASEAARQFALERASLASTSHELSLSRRQLTRRFSTALGMTPREFQRLSRFARACRRASTSAPDSWADVALDAGYCDQAHLNRDFEVFAGASPTRVFPPSWYRSFTLGS